MFSLRVRFRVLFLVTISNLSGSLAGMLFKHQLTSTQLEIISWISDSNPNEALNFCCKTGLSLDSCSEEKMNETAHNPPTGVCRTTMRLCCLYNPGITRCEADFIVNSFDRYCEKLSEKHETCCLACQLGQEMASEGKSLPNQMMHDFISNDSIFGLISACFQHTKRNIVIRDVEKLLGPGLFYNIKTDTWDDINECEIENNGCYQNQYCVNTQGSYACIPRSLCGIDYEFDSVAMICRKKQPCSNVTYITIREDFPSSITNEITDSIVMESRPRNSTLSVTMCRRGYNLNKITRSCDDINECQTNQNKCAQDCINFKGGFECRCRRGYRVDPRNASACVDIDECAEHKDLCTHFCQNFQGAFRCLCSRGYKLGLDMRSCSDIDECAGKENICGDQVCKNLRGSYICEQKCPRGYKSIKNFGKNYR